MNMKKLFFSVVLSFLLLSSAWAQKFAFVDTEYILDRIPAYKAAIEHIDKISQDYQKEIEGMIEEVEKLYRKFQNERVLLTEEQKLKREEEIVDKENSIKELQRKYFGPEGALFQKRQELIKPIQDEVYKAVKELAVEGAYAVIFDTASGAGILYENPRYNISDQVLQKMGNR